MSGSKNNEAVKQRSKNEPNFRKKVYQRKAKLYRNILSEIEFYFSDANLSKDQYLNESVSSCPFVPLEEFLKFNKFRSMALDVSDIQKAVKQSSVLELSEDGQRIRKKDSIGYDVDIRTVYVESIPVTASQIVLALIFSYFGRVQYISLPTFRKSKKIKGFGFVEYSRPQDAQKCINGFSLIGRKLPSSMPPEELSSIKMYNKQDTPTENKTIDKESKDGTRQDQIKNEDEISIKNKINKKTKDKLMKIMKKRQDKLHGLKVMSKTEWKVLRNKYPQKKNVEELKQRLQEKRQCTNLPAPFAEIDNLAMSESENNEAVEEQSKNEPNIRKRVRHRKSKLYRNILSQMEFYFSDANLSKDRYLGDLVTSCPFVPLEEFLKFNKIRALTVDIKDIQKALKKSSVLELSEDKERIRRKNPMVPYDVDIRTVYVESIPETVNREWLEMVFSDFGRVAYISLPRFRNSQRIKGFGFVEFTCPQDAQKCINAFTKVGLKLPSCMPPEELSSIKTFSVEVKEEVIEDVEEVPKKKARKHKEIKKLNIESDNDKELNTPMENKTIDKESKDELMRQEEIKKEDESTRKKKIKKKSKDKVKKFLEKSEAGLWGLQVLSKTEWKVLRNKYLNLQRKNMKELKKRLQEKRRYTGIPAPAAPAVEIDNSTTGQINRAKVHMERISGVFVKEVLPEPCLDVKLTKRMIRSNIHALHVEVKEGETEAIIRFDTAKAADDYCASSGSRARVLCGAEEEEQWTRAQIARSNKGQRGLAKLLSRSQALSSAPAIAPASPQPTHTHIRFDE